MGWLIGLALVSSSFGGVTEKPVKLELVMTASAKEAWEEWHRLLQDDAKDLLDPQPRVVEAADGSTEPFSLRTGPFDRLE